MHPIKVHMNNKQQKKKNFNFHSHGGNTEKPDIKIHIAN